MNDVNKQENKLVAQEGNTSEKWYNSSLAEGIANALIICSIGVAIFFCLKGCAIPVK